MHHALSGFGGFQRSQDGSCMILVVIRLMVGDVSSSRDIRYVCRCFSLYKDRNYNTSADMYVYMHITIYIYIDMYNYRYCIRSFMSLLVDLFKIYTLCNLSRTWKSSVLSPAG